MWFCGYGNQHSYHRELINARCPDPCLYSIGDIVFARHDVRSDSSRGQVDKLQYAFTGPWRISAILKGASYEIVHCDNATLKEKKSMHWTYHLTQLNLFRFSQWTKQTLGMDNYSNQLLQIHSRQQALRDSSQFSRSRFCWILLKQINVSHSIGPVSGVVQAWVGQKRFNSYILSLFCDVR